MKFKEYIRLSKLSLAARKKTTRSTVRGISFGLILLMPLLFLVMAFYLDLNATVNKDSSIRTFSLCVANNKSNSNLSDYIHSSYCDEITQLDGTTNYIKYKSFNIKNSQDTWSVDHYIHNPTMTLNVDGQDYLLNKKVEVENDQTYVSNYYYQIGINAIDVANTKDLFTQSDKELTNNQPLVAGTTFSDNSYKEIMVSSELLEDYNIKQENILNKKITLIDEIRRDNATDSTTSNSSTALDGYNGLPTNIMYQYKVVGIFNKDLYKSEIRELTTRTDSSSDVKNYFWISFDSLYDEFGATLLPNIIDIETVYDEYISHSYPYYYEKTPVEISALAKTTGLAYIPLGFGAQQLTGNNHNVNYNLLIEYNNYDVASKASKIIQSRMESSTSYEATPDVSLNFVTSTFANYQLFYNIFLYVCIGLGIFGGIIFFATLLNLYNTIHYSVQSRKNFLGMSRAIGMTSGEVIKMYFIEVFEIFKRSYLWTALFGGLCCGGIWLAFKLVMNSQYAELLSFKLSLNPIYILVSFAVLVVLNSIISIIFSLIACKQVAKRPILDLLVDDK